MISIDIHGKKAIYHQIYEQVREQIYLSEIIEGEKLPDIGLLAEQLGISSSIVKKAYLCLQEDKIVRLILDDAYVVYSEDLQRKLRKNKELVEAINCEITLLRNRIDKILSEGD